MTECNCCGEQIKGDYLLIYSKKEKREIVVHPKCVYQSDLPALAFETVYSGKCDICGEDINASDYIEVTPTVEEESIYKMNGMDFSVHKLCLDRVDIKERLEERFETHNRH